jgi:murein DD-endopeptidase MepM/ murein hydrolase activator NlpD
VISVVAVPNGYQGYGDIIKWLRSEIPNVKLDVISASSPDDLLNLLSQRIERGDPDWQPTIANAPLQSPAQVAVTELPAVIVQAPPLPTIRLVWPTDYLEVVQGFGENPGIYRRFGLPGHDGVDIKAPMNSNVYACADGQVYQVHDGSGGHAYGIHVRIRHAEGYSTVYGHLNQALVYQGQSVRAGERIGLADSTGNSTGSQLHLTLKKDGATAAGLTLYPGDIIDPSPYLMLPAQQPVPQIASPIWNPGRCLIGVE